MRCLAEAGAIIKDSIAENMRKFLWIVLLFISANVFAQKNTFTVTQYAVKGYLVKNNGDTVYSNIKKVGLDKIKLTDNSILNADSIKSFLFENINWISCSVAIDNDKGKVTKHVNIFFPQIIFGTMGIDLGHFGKAIDTNYSIICSTDRYSTLYEIKGISIEPTIYIRNDELGTTKMHYAKENPSEANQKIIEVLKKYTINKPQIARQLDSNFLANYKNVKKYLEEYIRTE